MDRAYEGDETRALAFDLGYVPVVPPKENRVTPWEYDRELYKRRNEVERLFPRMKGFRRIFSRFEKLDVIFVGFIHFVLIAEALRESWQPVLVSVSSRLFSEINNVIEASYGIVLGW